ncbi:UspA domain protein [Planctopirus limnophila DSM 3776]|uniref:UspA domain protein n=3 Tax=Planctopirus TaxID=1649480 RepID=D5SV07_PLAL2|nr:MULTISPECIES: STAS/SEC14 domain-containing protein [Planctopirus]ADG69293.1 UspA domain protein [Planctopirus limnophila DSM 3776]ODA28811.1 universal stress protein UspA [Planctopirus hydrillae]QDV28217.1 hypothetical protein Spb1_00800 [Planctopirus ephydatiae]
MVNAVELVGSGNLLIVRVTGKLDAAAYEQFVPMVEKMVAEHGKLRLLFEMHDFHGWTMGALWQDIKFDFKHGKDIEKLAIVGESKWEEGMAAFCKPFTGASIKYFDISKLEEAKAWIVA